MNLKRNQINTGNLNKHYERHYQTNIQKVTLLYDTNIKLCKRNINIVKREIENQCLFLKCQQCAVLRVMEAVQLTLWQGRYCWLPWWSYKYWTPPVHSGHAAHSHPSSRRQAGWMWCSFPHGLPGLHTKTHVKTKTDTDKLKYYNIFDPIPQYQYCGDTVRTTTGVFPKFDIVRFLINNYW